MYPPSSYSSSSTLTSTPHPDDSDANSEVSDERRGRWDDKVACLAAWKRATKWAGTRDTENLYVTIEMMMMIEESIAESVKFKGTGDFDHGVSYFLCFKISKELSKVMLLKIKLMKKDCFWGSDRFFVIDHEIIMTSRPIGIFW
ncbi:unnamed protein product [Caenorhabditis nigoni]